MDNQVESILAHHITNSAGNRMAFACKTSLFTLIITIILEVFISGLFFNLEYKLFLVFSHGILIIQYFILLKKNSLTKYVSYIIGEILNAFLIYFTYFFYPNYAVIWSQMSGYILYYYQAYLCTSAKSCIYLSIKQSALWLLVGIYYNKFIINDISCFLAGIFSLFALEVTSMYFEFDKEKEICKSKQLVKDINTKMTGILEAIQDLIIVLSKEKTDLFSNSALKDFTKSKDLLSVLSNFKYSKKYENSLAAHKTINEGIELALTQPVNTVVSFGTVEYNGIYIEWSGKVSMWDKREVLILIGRDVTKIIELEKENNENNYKSDLISTVSHELRTPTSVIMTLGSIIKDSKELSESNSSKIDILLGSCKYQLCLINDLLDYSQIVAGCLNIVKSSFNFFSLIAECTSYIQLQLGQQIQLMTLIDNAPEFIYTDPNRLKQILLNLLSNARKFTMRGSITLDIRYVKPKLEISCKDTGIGIPESKLPQLFKAFSKIENNEVNRQGVGLGLVISSMLIEKLGGEGIKVKSKVGVGSSFDFYIIISEPDSASSEIANENTKIQIPMMLVKSLSSKIEILIVDDVYFNIMAYVELFKSEGIHCKYAMNGEEAIELVTEKPTFSCILMDCEMPILDGWETTRRLISMKENKQIPKLPPIIGATAHADDEHIKMCFSAGMNDVISKPCSREVLFNKVKFWILSV